MGKNLKGKEIGKGIRQRKDGRYEARITIKGSGKPPFSIYGTNLQQLKKQRNMYLTEVLPGVPGFDSSMSVSKWYEKWMELYKVFKIKATTIRNYEDGFRRTEEYIGYMKLAEVKPEHILSMIKKLEDEIVLSGRREFVIGEEDWIGPEVIDAQLLDFPAETLPVMVTHRTFAGEKVSTIRAQKFMHGVSIRSIKRAGINVPVLARTVVDAGDILELTGMKHEVETAAKQMGYVDRPTNQTDMIFVGLGILVGGLVGALTMHLGGVPISLSTSGGALIAGLIFGWLRSKHPTFGGIPEPSLWVLNNVGLNMFIAVVGIAAGPSFVAGFKEVGFSLFIIGALATAIPLLSGLLMGKYLFKFHPALTLGCTAGARTTTAALGAVQDAVESETPALGYTVTYAVGNTLLIIWGVFIVLLM